MKPAFLALFFVLSLFSFSACEQPGGKATASTEEALDGDQPQADELPHGTQEPECGNANSSLHAVTRAGIVGGQAVDANSWIATGTVFIMQEYWVDRESRTSICTGSLIDTNLVMTAAHCVDRSVSNTGRLSVYFSHKPECENDLGILQKKRRSVADLRVHPNWNPQGNSTVNRGDIALLRIYGSAPANYKPLRLAAEFLPLEGKSITVAGYGMTNPDYYGDFGGSIALRHAEVTSITSAEKAYLGQLTGEVNEFDNRIQNEMLYIDQTQGKGICGGDSGGPSFVKNRQNEPVVTGVASFVMNPKNSDRLCAYVAAHTSTYFHKNWIESTFRQMRTAESVYETPFR